MTCVIVLPRKPVPPPTRCLKAIERRSTELESSR